MPDNNQKSTYDRSVDIVRNAIPRMSQLRIPITPSNYAVWYEYLKAENADLRVEMDALLSRDTPISDGEMAALYERFLDKRDQTVETAKQAVSQVVNVLMHHISQADGHYTSFSSELQEVADGLAKEISTDDLNGLIDRAVTATNSALEQGATMRQRFSELADEMEQLRGELARSQEEARADALTGLFNRLAFQEELDRMGDYADDDAHAPCLLLIDIDFFKRVNDTHGHQAGDRVLQGVAALLKESVRGRDIVARYGGEEFAVLLRDTPRSGCLAVADNLRRHVATNPIELPEELGVDGPVEVTVSLGGGWYRPAEQVEALIERADRALYRSKEEGRNRVTWQKG